MEGIQNDMSVSYLDYFNFSGNVLLINTRVIFQYALKANTAQIILAHKHPIGNLKPSEGDISIPRKIRDGGKQLDIEARSLSNNLDITDQRESQYVNYFEELNSGISSM